MATTPKAMKTILLIAGLAIALIAVAGFLWLGAQSNSLAERNAWETCINRGVPSGSENSPGYADNLICKSLYPNAYAAWHAEYYQ